MLKDVDIFDSFEMVDQDLHVFLGIDDAGFNIEEGWFFGWDLRQGGVQGAGFFDVHLFDIGGGWGYLDVLFE